MKLPFSFNGREYRLSAEVVDQLIDALASRGEGTWKPDGSQVDDTFASLAERLQAATGPPISAIELQGHEAAALVLALVDVSSPELARFYRDYAAENLWPHQPLTHVLTRSVEACFALKVGQWFFYEGLQAPIGGLDPETGEDLWPGTAEFAGHAAMNAAFAETANMWARLRGSTFGDERRVAVDTLAWLRAERELAQTAADAAADPVEQASASARVFALRDAALMLESCANRSRRPWEAPVHEA